MLQALKQRFGCRAGRSAAVLKPGIELGTVAEWWRLTRDFPRFRKSPQTPLKHFGYLAIGERIRRYKPQRILEFGHGFNPTLLQWFQDEHEVWGIDDCGGRPYMPEKDQWEAMYHQSIVKHCPKVHLVRGLIGKLEPGLVPENYFDLICSVSVLEEIKDLESLLTQIHRLLRPGGITINSFDWRLNNRKKYRRFVEAHWKAGFDIATRSKRPPRFDIHEILLEHCTNVIAFYQGDQTEERRYRGHYGTLIITAARCCDPPRR